MLPGGLLKEHWRALSLLMRVFDAVVFISAGWLAYLLRFQTTQPLSAYLLVLNITIFIVPVIFSLCNFYTSQRNATYLQHMMQLLQGVLLTGMVLACLSFLTKTGATYSRAWFIAWMVMAFFCLVIWRGGILLALRLMRKRGFNERRVVIYGADEYGRNIANTVQQALWTGYRIVALIDDTVDDKPRETNHIPIALVPTNLCAYLQQESIDELWIALPLSEEQRVKQILYDIRQLHTTTRFFLDIYGMDLLNHSVSDVAGFPVINIRSTPMTGINWALKEIEDRLIAAAILLLISPLLLFIAIGIKLSSKGPVFFKQKRLGWDGEIIKVYKFRTMVAHQEQPGEIKQATVDDDRITTFGKFLRRTSLDELPQFFNVMQGRMSIVGPRPHALAHNEQYKELIHTYMQRHRVKPGITGWAQVNGWRGETDTLDKMKKRVEYDLFYINNWSLYFDLKIILLTLLRGFINRNAY